MLFCEPLIAYIWSRTSSLALDECIDLTALSQSQDRAHRDFTAAVASKHLEKERKPTLFWSRSTRTRAKLRHTHSSPTNTSYSQVNCPCQFGTLPLRTCELRSLYFFIATACTVLHQFHPSRYRLPDHNNSKSY